MSYLDGELLIEAQVKQVDSFSVGNVGRGTKWKFLNSGDSDHYAVLRKGVHSEIFRTKTAKDKNYRTIIEVLQRVKDSANDRYDELLQHTSNITDRLDQYFQLADTANVVLDANITGGDEVKELWIQNTLAWIKVEIYLDWTEEQYVTFAE